MLLTGAGFTANFGGFLASEMWDRIFNRVSGHKGLRQHLLAYPNFETVRHEVSRSGDTPLLLLLDQAISDSFRDLDNILRSWRWHTPGAAFPVNQYSLWDFLSRFDGRPDEDGLIFSLNQDLLVERHYANEGSKLLHHPGIKALGDHRHFSGSFRDPIDPTAFLRTLTRPEDDSNSTRFYCVKLHGSWGLSDAYGRGAMVIGGEKEEAIRHDPLLAWYSDIFRRSIGAGGRSLLIAGYGFRDSHINRALSDAVAQSGLRLYILDPTGPQQLLERIRALPTGDTLISGIAGFFSFQLRTLFQAGESGQSEQARLLYQTFFGD